MRLHSFRLKIALLAGLLSGGLLMLAVLVFWEYAYRMNLDRTDREIRNLGGAQLDRVNGADHWVRFENALSYVAGSQRNPAFVIWVKHNDRVLYRSPQWPSAIRPDSFPEPTRYAKPFALDPGTPPPPPPRRSEPISASNPGLPLKETLFFTREASGKAWRFGVMGNPYVTLILGVDLEGLISDMNQLRRSFLTLLPIVLLMAGVCAWLLATRALRPLSLLTRTVEGITAQGLDKRISPPAHDREFVRLITVFNAMMDRLEKGFHQASRFSADAAHELRTPLTILQGELELALQAADPGSENQRLYSRLIEEISHLRAINDKLLLLAQADGGRLQIQQVTIDFSECVSEAAEDARILGDHLTVEENIEADIRLKGDPHLLPQILQNMISNAVRYNQPGGRIHLKLFTADHHAVLRVENTGPGIPLEDQERIFDRFHRVDPSRTRSLGGVGLGLSLAREIARAHGGELTLESSNPSGTVFVLRLPISISPQVRA